MLSALVSASRGLLLLAALSDTACAASKRSWVQMNNAINGSMIVSRRVCTPCHISGVVRVRRKSFQYCSSLVRFTSSNAYLYAASSKPETSVRIREQLTITVRSSQRCLPQREIVTNSNQRLTPQTVSDRSEQSRSGRKRERMFDHNNIHLLRQTTQQQPYHRK